MSTINTNGIDANYPKPGENNSSQGFRNNFANIKQNFNTAASEITDLQNKVVLKEALANSTLNNDMAGTLISNATTRNFRASTYNLGNALSGTVLVDVSLGDVQYGNITGNVTFQFGGWAPTNTESTVVLKLGISNANATINFPSEVNSVVNGFGVTILENYSKTSNVASVAIPNGVQELDYELATIDCGNTIYITPLNRPFKTTQVQPGVPISTGLRGQNSGTVSFGPSVNQVVINNTSNEQLVIKSRIVSMPNSSINGTVLSVGNTDDATMTTSYISGTTLYVGALTAGNIQVGMILSGTSVLPNTRVVENLTGVGTGSTWKVNISQTISPTTILGTAQIQSGMILSGLGVLANTYIISANSGTGAGSTWNLNNSQVLAGPLTITGTTGIANNVLYVGEISSGSIAQGTILSGVGILANTYVANNVAGSGSGSIWTVSAAQYASPDTINGTRRAITANSTADFYPDMPIVFTGNVFGNLVAGSTYYVKDVMNTQDFSVTLTPGGDGETYPVSTASGVMYGDPINYLYVCAADFDPNTSNVVGPKSVLNTYSTSNFVKLDNILSLSVNDPIVFSGSVFGGLSANVPFYIKSIDVGNSNVTISRTIINGIAGSVYELSTANSSSANACQAFSVSGPDIWRQIPLLPSTSQGSNITAANLTAAENLTVYGNAIITGTLTAGNTSYGNVSYINITTTGNANLENIFANNITSNTLKTNGVATFSDVSNVKIDGGLNGYFLQTDGTGNLAWAAGTTSPAPNTAAGSDTQVQYNDSGSFAGSPGLTFNNGSNTLAVAGNVNSANVTATENITTANLTVNELIYLTQVANIKLADSDSGNNGYFLQSDGLGSLVWSAGTLTPTGNGTSAGANNQVQIADGTGNFKAKAGFTFDTSTDEFSTPGNFNVTGNVVVTGNVFANTSNIKANLLEGTLTTNAQPNVTSIGTLSALTVNGLINANALFANTGTSIDPDTVVGFGAGNIVEPVFSPSGNAGIVIGKSTGQHGALIYTNNTLVFGTENGNTNSMAVKANLFSNGTFQASNFAGTIVTPLQTNITRVGTLTTLNVAGNLNAGNFVGNLANGSSNIRIPAAGGNINFSASANANILVVNGLGANITGNLDVSGNIIADNNNSGIIAGYVTANGNMSGNSNVSNMTGSMGLRALSATFTDTAAANNEVVPIAAVHGIESPIIASSNLNVTLANAATFAIVGEPANGINVNLNSANSYGLYVSGKTLLDGNLVHVGTTLDTTNANFTGNIITSNLQVTGTANLGTNASVIISGGTIGQYLQTDGAGGLSWAAGTANVTGVGSANGAAGLIQFASDGTGNFGAAAGLSFNLASNTLNLPGNLVATTGRITAANFVGRISSASPAQPNITSVGTLVSLTVAGNIATSGVNSGVKATFIGLNQDGSGNTSLANLLAVTNYTGLRTERKRYTDNAANAGSTINDAAIHVIGQPNFAASNTTVTANNATTFFIEGEPIANTNMTITNGYALWANGRTRINGNLAVTGSLTACSNVSFANIDSVTIGDSSNYAGYYLRAVGNGSVEWASGTVIANGITAAGNTTEIQFNDSGTVTGDANLKFTKSSGNLFVGGNANIAGNLTVGNVIYTNTAGAANQILQIDGSGFTSWVTPAATVGLLSNASGSSNIFITAPGGNIELNGTASKFILLKGNTLATADFLVGANTANRIKYQDTPPAAISFLKAGSNGNTYWSTDAGSLLANGTSNISIASNGDITFAVNGNIVGNVKSTGLDTTGTLKAGGVTYTNVAGSANQILSINGAGVTSWVNAVTVIGSTSNISNGNSNVNIASAGANVTIQVNNTANVVVISNAYANFTGNINSSANITATNNVNGANGVIGNLTANAYIIGSGGIITDSSTTRTLGASDNGKVLYFTSASAITVTTQSGLGAGFSCLLIQGGAGKITVAAGGGTNIRSYGGAYKTAGQYATVSIMCPTSNEFFMSGQTSST